MKVRLNKKTKEELSTGMVLGTLKTKQTRVEEDITTYIDEPFLKPENIRYGVTIAGVDGNYLEEIKYVNIWNEEGTLLRTLASTELNPTVGRRGDSVYLTNRPFEDQVAFGVGDHTCFVRWTPDQPESPTSFYDDSLNMTQAKQADVVIADGLLSWEEAFRNIPTSTSINIPYYVELPTTLTGGGYTFEFDELIDIGETSRMFVHRGRELVEECFTNYITQLETEYPDINK